MMQPLDKQNHIFPHSSHFWGRSLVISLFLTLAPALLFCQLSQYACWELRAASELTQIFCSLVETLETQSLEVKDLLLFICVCVYNSLWTDVSASLATCSCLPMIFGDLLPKTDACTNGILGSQKKKNMKSNLNPAGVITAKRKEMTRWGWLSL